MKRHLLVVLAITSLLTGPTVADTLLVANKTDGTVDLVETASGESRATLPTGAGPHEVAVSADGGTAVVSNYGHRETPGSTLTVINVGKAEVLRTIDLGQHTRPHGMAWLTERRLAVTTEGSAHLLVVDVQDGTIVAAIKTVQDTSHMVAVTPDGKRAFVANIRSGTVTAIDLTLRRKLGDIATGDGAEGIAVTPDGKHVWVTNRAADTISIVDTSTLEIVGTVECKGFPIRIAFTPDGKRALVSCAKAGEVAVIDTVARKELRRGKLDLKPVTDHAKRLFGDRFGESPVPIGLVMAPDGKSVWVAATQSDVVVLIDTETLEVRGLIQAGREPDGMGLSTQDASAS